MANKIRIVRNPLTLAIQFIGVTTNTEDPFGKRFTASPSGNNINVLNENMSVGSGVSIYTLRDVPYTDFLDAEGNAFGSVAETANYINNAASVGTLRFPQSSVGLAITVASGNAFEYEARYDRGTSYYWDNVTFPTGVDVSSGDSRKLEGTVNTPGTYFISLEVANFFGITTSTITLNVT